MNRKEEYTVRWIILAKKGLFKGKDAIKAVNERMGKDCSKECWRILDELLDTQLIELVGQNEVGEYLYKAKFQ